MKIAIVGRPNVGKSTLFNRLTGRRTSIIHDQPGVTRDYIEYDGSLGHLTFKVIDTPGLTERPANEVERGMNEKAMHAITLADAVLFVVDARAGLMDEDKSFARKIRKTGANIILVANKAEKQEDIEAASHIFAPLGFGEPVSISASHNQGMMELIEALETHEKSGEENIKERGEHPPIKVAFVGRPNAGKSTLINAILGEDRLLTGATPGITRDAVANSFSWNGQNFELVDTAGLRRKTKIDDSLEKMSASSSISSIMFAQVVVVVVDSTHPLEKQDLTIADLAEREGRCVIIACSKSDLIKDRNEFTKAIRKHLETTLPQLKGIPAILVSGEKKKGLDEMFGAITKVYGLWNKRVSTSKLNQWLIDAIDKNAPPMVKGKRIRLKFASQVKTRPPTIVFSTTIPEKLPGTYERYLVNDFRDYFDMPAVPIRILLKKQKNPFDDKG